MRKLVFIVFCAVLVFSLIVFTGCKQKPAEETKMPEVAKPEMQEPAQPSGEEQKQEETAQPSGEEEKPAEEPAKQ